MWVVTCAPLYKLSGMHTQTVTLMLTRGLPHMCNHLYVCGGTGDSRGDRHSDQRPL